MSKSPELPEFLYVVWEENNDPNEPCFLNAATEFSDLAIVNGSRRVGVYQLRRSRVVINQSKLVD